MLIIIRVVLVFTKELAYQNKFVVHAIVKDNINTTD